MKKITHYYLVLLFGFITLNSYAQLSDFTLNVTKTDETCNGNGVLNFTVSNTTPNASIIYKIYAAPNFNSAIAITEANSMSGLVSGNYKVIATQSFGSFQNTKEKTVTINSNIQSFNYNISSLNQNCESGGAIQLSNGTGTITMCEIIAGPVTRPLQTSLVFDGLPGGSYNVRAYNECGIAKVRSFSLQVVNSVLNISEAIYGETITSACDSILVKNTITPSAGAINYPVTVSFAAAPMDISGNEIIVNQYFATGDPDVLQISTMLPRLLTETYTYDVTVTDNCNTVYEKTAIPVDPSLILNITTGSAPCAEKFLKLNVSKFVQNYTVEFITYPEGFDPAAYNATPAGPFTGPSQYGDAEHSVPFGVYTVRVTDSCGRFTESTHEVKLIPPTPSIGAYNNGCFSDFGWLTISVPPQEIVSATLTAAPTTYSGPSLPADVQSFFTASGGIKMQNLPLGNYTFTFTDNCGFTYTKTVKVPEYVDKDFTLNALASCDEETGTVRFRSGNGDLTSAKIVAAPATFAQALPFEVTGTLNAAGDLYLNNLPEGSYTFEGTDICGVIKQRTVNVEGYNPPATPYIFTPKCGTFTVKVTDDSNGTEGATYWLQKYFPATNTWGHPQTGNTSYVEGTVPVEANAIKIYNNVSKANLAFSGKFRIIKKFESFSNGSSENSVCINVFDSFEYTDVLAINTAYTLACAGQPNDVALQTSGYPTIFRIKSKDGVNVNFNNGSSNVFHNLQPAQYVFEVEDACGNLVTQGYNVMTLPSIEDAQQPNDLVNCTEIGAPVNNVFNLTDQDATILGPLYSSMYTITYHHTALEADNGTNPLPAAYTCTGEGETIYIRLVNNFMPTCYDATKSFKLWYGESQEPTVTTTGTICNEGRVMLTANPGYDAYVWSTGETTQSIFVTEAGNYTVEVHKNYNNTYCTGTFSAEIIQSYTPQIRKIESEDWTNDENTITVLTEIEGNYEYSLDNVTYQDDNVFSGLEAGVYNVYVKDKNGCGLDVKEVVLLNYPNYFTPNGDGEHDKWHVKYSFKEPNFTVTIFDRYGKIITVLGSSSDGWDGTLNGLQLPSTDYWFVAKREDGRELRGHFAMVR